MDAPRSQVQGFTFAEFLVIVFVLAALFFLADSGPRQGGLCKGKLIQSLSNARQIHLAAVSMATDGYDNKDPELGWPGDLKANGKIATAVDYINRLVAYDYLKAGDLKVFAAPGVTAYRGQGKPYGVVNPPFEEKNNAFKMFLVKTKDAPETVFLMTKNYTYNTPLNDAKAKPFGVEGFVVCRKAGDAGVYKKQQAQALQILGPLPGGGTVESAENCLNPGATLR